MPLVHRIIAPVNVSDGKLELKGKYECEFVAVNNSTLVNVLRQLAALVEHASDIFSETATLTDQVGRRIRSVKLRLDELEAKTELFDPKLVPVPEGSLDDVSVCEKYATRLVFDTKLFCATSRPRFMGVLFDKAGNHCPTFPPRSPITTIERNYNKLNISNGERRPASFAALRDWKLDDYLDEKIATLDKKKQSAHELSRALASPFPSQLVQVDVTGQGFDRMRKSRRSLVIHTKRIRRSKRRNTICGSMPNKECGIQTSFSSVNSPLEEGAVVKKYGIDSGHWSSCTTSSAQEGANGPRSTASAPSPWDPTASISTSSDFLFDDEDRCLTPQLEHFTDGLVSDSDSVDTDGYFTSFRSDCGFPKSKKSSPGEACEDIKEGEEGVEDEKQQHNESDYDLFGKGSTSTTASSCGTVVLRNKPNPPSRTRTSSTAVADMVSSQKDDTDLEARVKRKSLIECVPSLVVVTPSPTLSGSDSPPPLKDPTFSNECSEEDSDRDSGRITPKAEDFSTTNDSECGTLSDTDSEIRSELRPSSTASSTGSGNSTMTLTSAAAMVVTATASILPQPDVIPDVQIIRTKGAPKLDVSREYFSLDTVLLNSSVEEERRVLAQNGDIMTKQHSPAAETSSNPSPSGSLQRVQSPPGSATSGKIRGARVVLDANGEIIFASETLRRKKRPKVSFDPGSAVKTMDYDNFATTYGRIRESVYDRIVKKDVDGKENEKLYECIEEIRKQNLRHPYLHLQEEKSIAEIHTESMNLKNNNNLEEIGAESNGRCSSTSSNCSSVASSRYASRPPLSPPKDDNDEITKAKNNILLLETDLDSAIPPSMPDLKNLPKIKDRLKRNESYRMANTDEEAAANARRPSPTNSNNANNASSRPALLSLSSPHLRMTMNNKLNRRMSFASSKDNSPHGNLHLNKKRDILEDPENDRPSFFGLPSNIEKSWQKNISAQKSTRPMCLEEDPIFIQHILNMTTVNANGGGKNLGNNNSNNSTPGSAYSSRITLSKLALSPEDRPTFLRREKDDVSHTTNGDGEPVWTADSPPTMDEISKEIYRFRKKFNIQSNATSRNLLPSQLKPPSNLDRNGNLYGSLRRGTLSPPTTSTPPFHASPLLDGNGNFARKTTSPSASTIPLGFPKLQVQFSSPISSSTPIKPSANYTTTNTSSKHDHKTYSRSPVISTPTSARVRTSTSTPLFPRPMSSLSISSYNSSIYSDSSFIRDPATSSRSSCRGYGQQPPPPPIRNFSSSGRKIFPYTPAGALNSSAPTTTSDYLYFNRNGWGGGGAAQYRRNSMSLAEPSPGALNLGPRTSLSDFKKLLQAAKPKKNSISAMEALKPKIGVETTL